MDFLKKHRRFIFAGSIIAAFFVAALLDSHFGYLTIGIVGMAACPGITDVLTRESGRISTDIYERNFATDPWNHLVRRAAWPEGEGEIISNLTYERRAPSVANPTWANISVVDGQEGGACLPPTTQVTVGSTLRTYNLQRVALEGPRFCAEEARSVFALNKQLDSIINILAGYTDIMWMFRHKHEYFRLSKRKVVVKTGGLSESNTMAPDWPVATANAKLSQGVLDTYWLKIRRDGASKSAMGKLDGQGVPTLIVGAETSRDILTDNADNRDDLRWGQPSELLKEIGVERSYRGFFHVIDDYPMRYTESDGVYTEVPPFVDGSATKGDKSDINPSWEAATHEAAFLYDPTVMTALIPEPITKPHKDFVFDPINYMGIWGLRNIPDEECNPDSNIIYHRGILASGSEPVHPERGVGFIFKRCDPPLNLVTACA